VRREREGGALPLLGEGFCVICPLGRALRVGNRARRNRFFASEKTRNCHEIASVSGTRFLGKKKRVIEPPVEEDSGGEETQQDRV
jgi:hypothetical protein